MAGHVAQRAGAEVPPAAPVVGMIDRVVRPLGGRAEEQVPVRRAGGPAPLRAGRRCPGACFQYLNGRLVQTWTSRIGPIEPERISSTPVAEAGVRPSPGCPSGWQTLLLGGRSRASAGPRRPSAPAASGSRRACPAASPSRPPRRGCGRACSTTTASIFGRQLLEQLAEVAVLSSPPGNFSPFLPSRFGSMSQSATTLPISTDVVGVARTLAADADAGEAQRSFGDFSCPGTTLPCTRIPNPASDEAWRKRRRPMPRFMQGSFPEAQDRIPRSPYWNDVRPSRPVPSLGRRARMLRRHPDLIGSRPRCSAS